jgi:creatinine amidohydrolase
MHAGEIETSLMLALYPELVNSKMIADEHPQFPDHLRCIEVRNIMKSGVMGSASLASKEKGIKLFKNILNELLGLIDTLTIE